MEQCKHASLTCVQESVDKADIKLAIIRCSHCGIAISALYPQAPNVLNAIIEKLDVLQSQQKINH
jgi:uncharacterized protein (UPF0212 family)